MVPSSAPGMLISPYYIGIYIPYVTTGNSIFAECHMLCQVPNIGHSAKRLFAECRSRQRFTLGKARHSAKKFFAECPALGKDLHSAKTYAQTVSPNGDPLPSARSLTLGKEFLCRVSESWHSTKNLIFFLFAPKFFVKPYYSIRSYILKFGTFFMFLLHLVNLYDLLEFFS
jgi:hypothetical protein